MIISVLTTFLGLVGCTLGMVCPVNTVPTTTCVTPSPIMTPPSISTTMTTMLNVHNGYRKTHRVPPLRWNSTVATSAYKWTKSCNITHDRKAIGVWGENILYGKVPISTALHDAPRMWYNEVKTYNYSAPVANHFTQMVWKATSSLGCAYNTCNNTAFVVCRYYPPGNVYGKFKNNVFPSV